MEPPLKNPVNECRKDSGLPYFSSEGVEGTLVRLLPELLVRNSESLLELGSLESEVALDVAEAVVRLREEFRNAGGGFDFDVRLRRFASFVVSFESASRVDDRAENRDSLTGIAKVSESESGT